MTTPELRSNELVQVLRLPQVCKVTGLCRSMIYQLEADLRFPQRVKIGVRAVGWLDKEVNAWLLRRIELSRANSGSGLPQIDDLWRDAGDPPATPAVARQRYS